MERNTKDLYAITVYFNPLGWKRRKQLYEEFVPWLEWCGVKLITVEIAYKDEPYQVTCPDNEWHVQLRSPYQLWHKEKGINIGIQRLLQLVPDAQNIAWIDADIRLSNHHWVDDTIKALQHHCVVQLFSEAHNMNPRHESMWKCPSVFRKYVTDKGFHQSPPKPLKYLSGGHPGLAWAARRETLDQLGGLLDFCIAGSGDTHMANALMGDVHLFKPPGMSPGFTLALDRWAARADHYVKQNVGFVHGMCYHYWHGKSEQRGYEKRWDIQCYHKFDPTEDIYPAANGLYQFKWGTEKLQQDLFLSMKGRNEDSIDE